MKNITLALVVALVSSSAAMACTPEELQSKAMDLSTQMQTLVAKDPQKAGEVGQKMAAIQTNQATDMDSACKLYDDLLAEIAAAE